MTDIIKTDSRYLHGEDLQRDGKWCEFRLTIESVGDENSAKAEDGSVIEGWPVHFKETPKVLVLNKTNTKLAVAAVENNSRSKWPGKILTVYPVTGNWFGQPNTLAVRVRVPEGIPRPFIQPSKLGRDLCQK